MDRSERQQLIEHYRTGAAEVDAALAGITDEELDRRPPEADGWTARQVSHHLADSEAMAYTRLRRLIADDDPVISGYDEPVWARRLHYDRPIEPSVAVLRAVRAASLQLLEAIDERSGAEPGRTASPVRTAWRAGSGSTPGTRTSTPTRSGPRGAAEADSVGGCGRREVGHRGERGIRRRVSGWGRARALSPVAAIDPD